MRVLIVTDEMEIGGSQRQITELALGLRRGGDEVCVAWFRNGSFLLERLEAAGVEVVHLPKSGRVDPRFVRAFVRLLARGRFDVAHAFAFSAELWTTIAIALSPRGARPALVTSIRGTYEWYGATHWRIKAWITDRSAAVVANAGPAARYAFEKMARPTRTLAIVRNGLAVPEPTATSRARARIELGLGPDDVAAIFVGRLVDHKNVPMLIRALARLAADGGRTRVVVVGDGPQRAALQAMAQDAGVAARIGFLGARDDAVSLMHGADMLVLPSWREGLPNVVIEAMQAGCPVVATRVGGVPEIVEHDVDGLLVDPDDDRALAQAMLVLERDAASRERLRRHAMARARSEHSVETMVAAMRAVYAGVAPPAAAAERSSALGIR